MIPATLRKHMVAVLAGLATVFLAIIIIFYAWGISAIVAAVNEANSRKADASAAPQFNLDAAAKLDYRGTFEASPAPPADSGQ